LKKLALGGAVIGTASLGVYHWSNQHDTNIYTTEYDVDGNPMTLMQLETDSQL